jgi:uncharacterized NAD(P)/FAD-binding protein YdhS
MIPGLGDVMAGSRPRVAARLAGLASASIGGKRLPGQGHRAIAHGSSAQGKRVPSLKKGTKNFCPSGPGFYRRDRARRDKVFCFFFSKKQCFIPVSFSKQDTLSGRPYTVAIVGGGFSGAVFGLKLHLAQPDWRVVIIEPSRSLGRGIAYGACGPQHLLNVPVSRMEIGLQPSFAAWLQQHRSRIAESLVESGLDTLAAYVPRGLFGDYLSERIGEALDTRSITGLTTVRGEAVRMLRHGQGILLTDGREIEADIVVLAMGNLPPRPPGGPDPWLYDTGYFVPDPWAMDAFAGAGRDEPLLLIGAGLTMVDVALRLASEGHRGPMLAVSRRGLLPLRHEAGGAWSEFLAQHGSASPLALLRIVRQEVARAAAQGVPWQRVFDAARPAVPGIWHGWTNARRRQFSRHLRVRWDIHRHRMAPRIDDAVQRLRASGRLEVVAGRIIRYAKAGPMVDVTLRLRGGGERVFRAGHVINCTGPGAEFDKIAVPLIADLRERRLAASDRWVSAC